MQTIDGSPFDVERHLKRVRVWGLLSLVLVWAPLGWVLSEQPAAVVPLLPPFLLPVFAALLLLVVGQRKLGLTLAEDAAAVLAPGSLIAAALVLWGRPSWWGIPWPFVGGCLALAGVYGALFREARRALDAGWSSLPRRHLVAIGLLPVCGLFGLLFAVWTLPHWSRPASNEYAALATLRTLREAAKAYSEAHGGGFPARLDLLGPTDARSEGEGQRSCERAGLIDGELAQRVKNAAGFRSRGYLLEYRPVPPLAGAIAACPPIAEGYTLTARPLAWDTSGRSSFLLDQTGVIRYTTSNRTASPTDSIFGR